MMNERIEEELSVLADEDCFICGKPASLVAGYEDDAGHVNNYSLCSECLEDPEVVVDTITKSLRMLTRMKQNLFGSFGTDDLDESIRHHRRLRDAIRQMEKLVKK